MSSIVTLRFYQIISQLRNACLGLKSQNKIIVIRKKYEATLKLPEIGEGVAHEQTSTISCTLTQKLKFFQKRGTIPETQGEVAEMM